MITSTPDPRKTEYAQFRAAWLNQVRCNRAFPHAAYKFSSSAHMAPQLRDGGGQRFAGVAQGQGRDFRDLPAETDPAFRGAGDSPGHPRRRPAGQPLSVPDHRRWRGGRAPVGGAKSGPGAPSCAPPRESKKESKEGRGGDAQARATARANSFAEEKTLASTSANDNSTVRPGGEGARGHPRTRPTARRTPSPPATPARPPRPLTTAICGSAKSGFALGSTTSARPGALTSRRRAR